MHFESKTESINLVESMVDSVCDEYKIHDDNYGNILVAVTEAVNNAIQHGNKYDPGKNIEVLYGREDDRILSFVVSDQGNGFDYNSLPDPTDPENIEKPHGRGIFLMQHLADKVEFSGNGRIVRLEFDLSAN